MFSFGCIVCEVVTQDRPFDSLYEHMVDLKIGKSFVVYHFKARQRYLDIMRQGPLKQLAMRCLDYNAAKRPSIFDACEEIDQILKGK